ncbi:MAG: ABC transporter ATP-binding protein, partial [Oscillospiraceae bacterium]
DDFYSLLLDDYTKTNRTFIVSTHIIEEAVNALEEIILIDNGNIIENCNIQDFISQFHYIQGKDSDVDEICKGITVLHSEGLGRSKIVCVRCTQEALENAMAGKDVDISPVPLHKIFVYVTTESSKGE